MRDHTSLRAWQEARLVSVEVLRLVRRHWRPHASALFAQLQRASLSVQLNIAEGYAYAAARRFVAHLGIAYASAIETGELLELVRELDLAPGDVLDPLVRRSRRSQRLILGLLKAQRRACPP